MANEEKLRALLAEPVESLCCLDADLMPPCEHALELKRERDESRAVLSSLCSEFEGAVRHADWRAAGSPGMSVPFTGDFASATQLPSVVGRMRWWSREMRKCIGEDKP